MNSGPLWFSADQASQPSSMDREGHRLLTVGKGVSFLCRSADSHRLSMFQWISPYQCIYGQPAPAIIQSLSFRRSAGTLVMKPVQKVLFPTAPSLSSCLRLKSFLSLMFEKHKDEKKSQNNRGNLSFLLLQIRLVYFNSIFNMF